MIKIRKVSKSYEKTEAVRAVDLTIQDGEIFGLLGTNGAGKSTLLRLMAGILKPEEGMITVDGSPVWDNPSCKEKIFFISDDQYFFPNITAAGTARFYSHYYPRFAMDRFRKFLKVFDLMEDRKITTFSKGMRKQLSIILGICSGADYLLCDETFDGLDPVMRQGIKSLFAREMDERGLTPVIASHNLRELEDICDHIGLLHRGGVLLSKDLSDLKGAMTKIQCVLPPDCDEPLREGFDIIKMERRGRLITLIVRGKEGEILEGLAQFQPVFCEALPLSLEEIFISETEVVGYDIRNLIS